MFFLSSFTERNCDDSIFKSHFFLTFFFGRETHVMPTNTKWHNYVMDFMYLSVIITNQLENFSRVNAINLKKKSFQSPYIIVPQKYPLNLYIKFKIGRNTDIMLNKQCCMPHMCEFIKIICVFFRLESATCCSNQTYVTIVKM